MPRMTTAEAVIESLIAHGIDTLFALPGVHNDHLFDAAHKASDRIRVIHPRHEQTAAYMALGAALVTGKPQAFAVVPGPGILNASAALLLASAMGAPVIALAGQIPSFAIDQGHGHLHEIHDQIGLLRHIVKLGERIRSPEEASARVATAISVALSGRTGPVALECAIDTWGQSAEVTLTAPFVQTAPCADPATIAAAADILANAKRPLIVVGGGALDAGPELQAVAELLHAPVSSFRRGQGSDPDQPSARGVVHRGPRVMENRRRGVGRRHATILATKQLGRGRRAENRSSGHRPRRNLALSPPRLRFTR